ncbi:uncharacterized protein LOC127761066 [Oryza glaberrima]|uniref:uncharacterized protein LOC127761066 n=1 Tax=Oryza glaberrima TaxID=4538 RepID=UPI00224C2851|nr:uncharacterized protein LOC127761066 [Oryza glaberrima]
MDNNTHVSTPESSSIPTGDASLGVLSDITNLSAAELRRKHARERYALLSVEDKEARNKKAREKRQQKKEDSQGDNQSATTADGIETRQPMITPRRLSFTVRNGVAHYDDIENNECPLSCIVQRASQDSLKLDFVRDKSATKSSHEAMDNDPMIMENTRVGASQSLPEEQLEWRRARDRFNYAALTPEHKQAILDRRRS